MTPFDRYFSRLGTGAAALGIVVYTASVFFHPGTPPHETRGLRGLRGRTKMGPHPRCGPWLSGRLPDREFKLGDVPCLGY
jgi:hypothetical protein